MCILPGIDELLGNLPELSSEEVQQKQSNVDEVSNTKIRKAKHFNNVLNLKNIKDDQI